MKDALGHGSNAHGEGIEQAAPRPLYGRVSAKNGRIMGEYGPHPTREAAINEALFNHPSAKHVSTYYANGLDIQFHRNPNPMSKAKARTTMVRMGLSG